MAFDGIVTRAIVSELQDLIGSKIDKEVVLKLKGKY